MKRQCVQASSHVLRRESFSQSVRVRNTTVLLAWNTCGCARAKAAQALPHKTRQAPPRSQESTSSDSYRIFIHRRAPLRLIAQLRNQLAIEKRCEHRCFQEDMSHENTMYGIRKVRYGTIKRTVPRHQRGKLSRKSRSISLSVPFKSCDKRSKDARIMRQQNGQNWGVSCHTTGKRFALARLRSFRNTTEEDTECRKRQRGNRFLPTTTSAAALALSTAVETRQAGKKEAWTYRKKWAA